MIEIKDISKSFEGRVILDGISAVMDTGKCNLIIGASGSGKTVLTKCMVGLFKPETGLISYDGNDMVTMDKKERKNLRQKIGMLFQGSALFDSMTVEENVLFPLHMFTNLTLAEKKKRAAEVLERVNLQEAHKRYPRNQRGDGEAGGDCPRHCTESPIPFLRRAQFGAGSANLTGDRQTDKGNHS